MDYKHFSHTHGLIVHQLPGESQITCSGCKFPGTGSVYACWQCSYFLHEQCFNATRSMNHPSHPIHPLNLIPYPTYPCNSFFCNSCNLVGTGLSYSCSNCEFDLHVHCAFMPSTTITNESYPSSITLNYPIPSEPISQNNPLPMYPPHSYGIRPTFFPHIGGTVTDQHQTGQPQYVSYPAGDQVPKNNLFPNEPIPVNDHTPFDHLRHYETIPSFDPQISNTVADQHQIGQPQYVSHPVGDQLVPKTNFFPNEPMPVNDHTPIDHSRRYETLPSFNPQMGGTLADQHQTGQPQYVSYPAGDHVPKPNFFPNEPIPLNDHIPIDHSCHYEAKPSFKPQIDGSSAIPLVLVPEKPEASQPPPDEDQTPIKKQIKHFSHRHPLRVSEFQEDDSIVCSGCKEDLVGLGYSCIPSKCEFNLHKSCFELALELKHESHLEHPLALLASPPYKKQGEFTCNACLNVGSSFNYHCNTCQFDLHVTCATLPKTAKREDHEHALVLLYSMPKQGEDEEEVSFTCDVCNRIVDESCWMYYCKECDFGTHLECVSEPQDSSEPQTYEESLFAVQNQMQLLNFQMEMNRKNAEFMAGLFKSTSSLL